MGDLLGRPIPLANKRRLKRFIVIRAPKVYWYEVPFFVESGPRVQIPLSSDECSTDKDKKWFNLQYKSAEKERKSAGMRGGCTGVISIQM